MKFKCESIFKKKFNKISFSLENQHIFYSKFSKIKREIVDILDEGIVFVTSNKRECLKQEVTEVAEKLFFKYALLIPTGLSDDQKREPKKTFFQDAIEFLGELLDCKIGDAGEGFNNEVRTLDFPPKNFLSFG